MHGRGNDAAAIAQLAEQSEQRKSPNASACQAIEGRARSAIMQGLVDSDC